MTTTAPVIGNFAEVPLNADRPPAPPTEAAVEKHVAAAAAAHWYTPDQLEWHTPEDIAVKPVYIGADRAVAVQRDVGEVPDHGCGCGHCGHAPSRVSRFERASTALIFAVRNSSGRCSASATAFSGPAR